MASAAPSWFERFLLPELNALKGEIKALSGRIDGLDGKMTGQFEAVQSEVRRLDEKLDSTRAELGERIDSAKSVLSTRIDNLDQKLDVVQRLAVVETKLKEYEAKAAGSLSR
jgi:chromosome segregation ATPase